MAVPNRHFGVFEGGELKVRGLALRRGDTPLFVAQLQGAVLDLLARHESLDDCLPAILTLLRQRLAALRAGEVPLERLLVSQRLSREVEAYKTPAAASRAAQQLQAVGKPRCPEQRVRFLYTRDAPGVVAWDLPEPPDSAMIDAARYTDLAPRAVQMVLQPWGICQEWLVAWVQQEWVQGHLYLR